jgi:hypothetical protein
LEGCTHMLSSNDYSWIDRKIAFALTKFPKLKSNIKYFYQKLNYVRYKKLYTWKSRYPIKNIELPNKESYFGYYDKSPLNSKNEYIIFQSTNINTKKLPDPNIPIDITLYNINNDSYQTIDQSYTYNWQQGAKLMWLSAYEFIFNNYDRDGCLYISKIYNINLKEFRIIHFPIYDCYKDKFAISLNFDRLNIGRADYAYSNREVEIDWSDNSNDGLYFIDLKKNSSMLIITIHDIIKLNDKDTMKDARHKFNHIMISPNGCKVMFIHRWFTEGNRRYDTLIVCDIDGSNIKIIADDDMVSHCYWYGDENILAYLRDKEMGDKFYIININNSKKEIIGENIIDKFGDGHPSVNKEKILYDTYPNKARMKDLFLYDTKTKDLNKLGEFFESFDYYAETRCDLHPRFSYDGKKVFFDSVHSGKRQLYMMDLDK